ncbi:hypothetical protein J31TS6_60080 [Brevibacillus reuszeri]|uniref:TolB family protein n=1 Tax=Brevibacillus reuszeri TaxID=54915 RepID=UPI001B1F5169|nr:hypothetical protein [Brevibacillus reuszeri]GIO09980.1 hypothetical protein J31TS6_60080 [Brevibacillus reuszeri]
MQAQRPCLWQIIVMAGLLTMLICFMTGCDFTPGRKMTVIDPPTDKHPDTLALERIDRLDEMFALAWLSEEELLYLTNPLTTENLQIHNLKTGASQATAMRAERSAVVSPDRKHVFLLSDLQAGIADLNSGQVISLPTSDDRVSWILRDAVGAWANDQAYVLPIVKGDNKYSLLYARVNGTATPVSIPDEDQPIQKVMMHGESIYYLTFDQQLKMLDEHGKYAKLISHQVADFALSPDGIRIALALVSGKDEVSLILSDAQGQTQKSTGVKGRLLQQLSWSPDGHRLAFAIFNLAQGMTGLYVMDTLTGSMLPLSTFQTLKSPIVWSPSGQQLLISQRDESSPDSKAFSTIYRFKTLP